MRWGCLALVILILIMGIWASRHFAIVSQKLYSKSSRTIAVRELSWEDVALFAEFPELQVMDARGCTDYPQLMAFQKQRPDCTVLYQVPIGGIDYPQNTGSIVLSEITEQDAQMLDFLPELKQVDATGCRDYALLASLRQEHPQWELVYSVLLSGTEYPWDTEELVVEGASEPELSQALSGFPNLKSLLLKNPQAEAWQLLELRENNPDIEIQWELTVEGKSFRDDITELDISYFALESTDQACQIAAYFPELEKLIVDSGNIDNETMASFREEMRAEYKVVWTVTCGTGKFGSFTVRTDETTFMPLKHGIYFFLDDDMYNVRYCEDMVCMDVGHMTFQDVSFVEYMPHLKYLILTLTDVRDITPLSSCKELVFLELGHTGITDYSPLLGCTALEDLNLGRTYGDPEPLKQMTWLKNIWWVDRSMSVMRELEEALPDTNLLFRPEAKDTTSFGWRQLQNYYDMRDLLEMPYMQ